MGPTPLPGYSRVGKVHGIDKSLVAVGDDETKIGSCKASHEEVQEKPFPGMFALMLDYGKIDEFPLAFRGNAVGRRDFFLLRPEAGSDLYDDAVKEEVDIVIRERSVVESFYLGIQTFSIVEMVWALTESPSNAERACPHLLVETPKRKTFCKASSISGILCI
jgi:hypothetical protein